MKAAHHAAKVNIYSEHLKSDVVDCILQPGRCVMLPNMNKIFVEWSSLHVGI